MVYRFLFTSLLLFPFITLFSQTNSDQNGIKTSVTNTLFANATQARRYEIATIAYNSYHWQNGGVVIVELFAEYYGTGYEKYVIENGFGQGANSGTPIVKLVESYGINHLAKVTLGNAVDLNSTHAGYINKALPVYLDVMHYAGYKAKVTYLQNKVAELTGIHQIKINENPNPVDIPNFTVSQELYNDKGIVSSGNLRISGSGNHYIQNGNVGIGTTDPKNCKLAVEGTIGAREVVVLAPGTAWPDYVFAPEYKLRTLDEIEQFVKDKQHLPDVPSAEAVAKDGVNLGEMNAILLRKVEELTLHLIEQGKQMEELKMQVDELKANAPTTPRE